MASPGVAVGVLALVATVSTPPELHAERTRVATGAVVLAALSPKPMPALQPLPSNRGGAEIVPAERHRTVKAKRGDTFMKLMLSAGAARAEAHLAIVAMRRVFDPRDLDVGQALTTIFRKDRLFGLSFRPSADYTVRVTRNGDAFQAKKITHALIPRDLRVSGSIRSNLYVAATEAGMPASVLANLVRLLSWDVDFQRDIQKGDRFDVLVERFDLEDGRPARWGNILYAELMLSGTPIRLYRHETKRQGVEYFDEKGRGAQKALMKTPINGARLSSGFGRRRHPILGYNRMHRGVDFAAPRGTPIYAAGGGRIRYVGRKGAYGRYIRIRHNGRYATAYAHLRRFARGVRRGKRVRQGQIIGYVGTSGRSTGPHLHYEILVNGRQVNPRRLRLPSGRRLKGRALKVFHTERAKLDRRRAAVPTTATVTSR
ncbi:MAG: peptidoglycan DD-metalloendopeptidase family protein [Alphaproteobacteria bacterium]